MAEHTSMATFTSEEVSEHRTAGDCWIIRGGRVYDVSRFSEKHPGGREVLLAHAGQDVTAVMLAEGADKNSHHAHSANAYSLLEAYYIGDLQGSNNNNQSEDGRDDLKQKQTDLQTQQMHGWREDELVDWSQPIFWQVGSLGTNYSSWVHSPVNRHIRLFYSDFVEFFSRTPWYFVPIVWVPFFLLGFYLSYVHMQREPVTLLPWLPEGWDSSSVCLLNIVLCGVLGVSLWSFFEYVIHRWIFHLPPPPTSKFLITAHFLLHGQHHKAPLDNQRLVFPPVPAAVFAGIIYMIYFCILPRPIAWAVYAGTGVGYVSYDLTHYYLHHGNPCLSYFKRLKHYHVLHHFVDQNSGFGISSKLWDYPFGTLIKEKSPEKVH